MEKKIRNAFMKTYDEYMKQYLSGVDSLKEGVDALKSGMQVLNENKTALGSGAQALTDGLCQFSNSLSEISFGNASGQSGFDFSGVENAMVALVADGQKLTDLAGDDLTDLTTKIRGLKQIDSEYQNFGGIYEGQSGSVRFIIETEEIKK